MAQDSVRDPLSPDDVSALPVVPASSPMPADARLLLGSYVIESRDARAPEVAARLVPLPSETDSRTSRFSVDLEIQGARLPLTKQLPASRAQAGNAELARQPLADHDLGYHPPFHDLRSIPERRRLPELPPDWQFLDHVVAPGEIYPFLATSFPWCVFGRVTTEGRAELGWTATGVMVGPRHLLTSNRIVKWGTRETAGWLEFAPAYSQGSTPFGTAYAERVYWWRQLEMHFPTIHEHRLAFDYVVCVLNRRIGDLTGWAGWAPYQARWDGWPVWSQVGYSTDFADGQEPVFQNKVQVTNRRMPAGTDPPGSALILENNAKIGQYFFKEMGGPVFGWWGNEPWPRVVAVFSVSGAPQLPITDPNHIRYGPAMAVGGQPLVWLIEQARAEHP